MRRLEDTMASPLGTGQQEILSSKTEKKTSEDYCFEFDNTGSFTKAVAKNDCVFTTSGSTKNSVSGEAVAEIRRYNASNVLQEAVQFYSAGNNSIASGSIAYKVSAGEYVTVGETFAGSLTDNSNTTYINISATPTGISTGIVKEGETPLSAFTWPEYDISSQLSASSGTITYAYGTPYQKKTGEWWLKISGSGSAVGNITYTLNGVVFSGNPYSAMTGWTDGSSSVTNYALSINATNTFVVRTAGGAGDTQFSGDVPISGQPTWATDTTVGSTISAIVAQTVKSGVEQKIGTWFGSDLYQKCYSLTGMGTSTIIDTDLNITDVNPRNEWGALTGGNSYKTLFVGNGSSTDQSRFFMDASGLSYQQVNFPDADGCVEYTKN